MKAVEMETKENGKRKYLMNSSKLNQVVKMVARRVQSHHSYLRAVSWKAATPLFGSVTVAIKL